MVQASIVALIAAAASFNGTLQQQIGKVTKHTDPLFVQDKPWEPRLDNGYPNVIPPSTDEPSWQIWYGDCISGCGTQVLLYANSTDGLIWVKPSLGIFDVGTVRKDLAHIGTENNIVLIGGGIGVYRDDHEENPRARYKAFGEGCFTEEGTTMKKCSQNTAVSTNGLHWTDAEVLAFPQPQRYDCHNQIFFDASREKYIMTTRDGFSASPGRAIGMAETRSSAFDFDTSKAPTLVEAGDLDHQLYSQISFRWAGIYLGIVMVYDATSSAGTCC